MKAANARKARERREDRRSGFGDSPWVSAGYAVPTKKRITREQLLEALLQQGIEVSTSDLLHWQAQGVIPYGIRAWNPEKGVSRILYPGWMIAVLAEVRRLQGQKRKLQDIGPELHAVAAEESGWDAYGELEGEESARPSSQRASDSLVRELKSTLDAIAHEYKQQSQRSVVRIQAHLEFAGSSEGTTLVVRIADESGKRFLIEGFYPRRFELLLSQPPSEPLGARQSGSASDRHYQ